MKTLQAPSLVIFLCNLLFITSIATGQTVTIGTISGSQFCAGDPIAVSFTATGFWGHRNAFTLQLSDPTGSFNNGFQNIGSLIDTLPGTFTINTTIPASIVSSTHYRFRVLAAIPYTTTADNGSDIQMGTRPTDLGFGASTRAGSTGVPITFNAITGSSSLHDSVFWDFGSGATPANVVNVLHDQIFSQSVTYATSGDKTVTLSIVAPGGCSKTMTLQLHIYDCSFPAIPHDAIVINSNMTVVDPSKTYWINPGLTVSFIAQGDTVFAEPGSTIKSAAGCVLYMKQGSVFISSGGNNSVIYGDGASINSASNDFTFSCPTLDFDYTNAPPNAAHPVEAVKNNFTSNDLTLSPNPTTGMVIVHGLPLNNLNVSVLNILGETMIEQKNLHSPNFTLDLSKLVPGTYYIRFSSANSVVTKMVVRE